MTRLMLLTGRRDVKDGDFGEAHTRVAENIFQETWWSLNLYQSSSTITSYFLHQFEPKFLTLSSTERSGCFMVLILGPIPPFHHDLSG